MLLINAWLTVERIFLLCNTQKIREMTRNLGARSAWLLKPTISKFCHSSYMVITLQNLKILQSLLLLSHPTISKFYQLARWIFWGVSNPSWFFLEISRNYASIIITIISNITVIVSHNVTCFGYFMPMSNGVNRKAPTIVSPTPIDLFVVL